MEMALGLFVGLVLFAAFGKPVAKFVKAASPAAAALLAATLRLVGWAGALGILVFAALLLRESKWEDGERLAALVAAGAAAMAVVWVCHFASGLLAGAAEIAHEEMQKAAEEDDEDEDEQVVEPKPRKKRKKAAASAAQEQGSDSIFHTHEHLPDGGKITWSVNLESMAILWQGHPYGKPVQFKAYQARRTKEGDWMARRESSSYNDDRAALEAQEKDSVKLDAALAKLDQEREWFALEDINEHLATVIETRWRRYTRN